MSDISAGCSIPDFLSPTHALIASIVLSFPVARDDISRSGREDSRSMRSDQSISKSRASAGSECNVTAEVTLRSTVANETGR